MKGEVLDAADSNDGIVVTEVASSGGGRWGYVGVSGGLGDWFNEHL